jgi:hydroxybutyrate-dimer hydrolase
MVHVPETLRRSRACIVTGTSSGSRGVHDAIATSGEWGMKRGCAVVYADAAAR